MWWIDKCVSWYKDTPTKCSDWKKILPDVCVEERKIVEFKSCQELNALSAEIIPVVRIIWLLNSLIRHHKYSFKALNKIMWYADKNWGMAKKIVEKTVEPAVEKRLWIVRRLEKEIIDKTTKK